ncbi:MAG: hypothetical protein WCW25_00765 [Patescibacteria group bacterium]
MEQNNSAEKEFIAAHDQYSRNILRHIYYRVNDNARLERNRKQIKRGSKVSYDFGKVQKFGYPRD